MNQQKVIYSVMCCGAKQYWHHKCVKCCISSACSNMYTVTQLTELKIREVPQNNLLLNKVKKYNKSWIYSMSTYSLFPPSQRDVSTLTCWRKISQHTASRDVTLVTGECSECIPRSEIPRKNYMPRQNCLLWAKVYKWTTKLSLISSLPDRTK